MPNTLQYDLAALQASLKKNFENAVSMISRFNESEFNLVPFPGSWTVAQVTNHLTLSNLSIAKALALPGSPINRDPGERIVELKDVFLNFKEKYRSPSFILPKNLRYDMKETVNEFSRSFEQIMKLVDQTDLSTMINHDAFGDITKLEILHFVLYHTRRHCHQLETIRGIIQSDIIQP